MASGKNRDHTSFWFWMFALFVTALPCIGPIMVVVWAIIGENESRKNYFRAVIAWTLIIGAVWMTIMLLGFWPVIKEQIVAWLKQLK